MLPLLALLGMLPADLPIPAPKRDRLECACLRTDYQRQLLASGRPGYAPRFRIDTDNGVLAAALPREPGWAVFVDAPQPALLATRPRAQGGADVLLARCVDGSLVAETLGVGPYAMLLVDWLDGPEAAVRGGSRWSDRPGIGAGGSLLYLDGLGVLDTHDWRLRSDLLPTGFRPLSWLRPLGAAPDRRRYARIGLDARDRWAIGVIALGAGRGEILALTRAARRQFESNPQPARWFARHYEWQALGDSWRLRRRQRADRPSG